jgi:formylmethanofuran dehydrogenase subunit B
MTGGCPRSAEWFTEAPAIPAPTYQHAGPAVSRDEAIRASMDFVRNSRRPAIVGLMNATIETQSMAATWADRTRSLVHVGLASSSLAEAELLARQALGKVGATWGEIRHRADLIVYLGRPPEETHPRLAERYLPQWCRSAESAGGVWIEVGPGRWTEPGGATEHVSRHELPSSVRDLPDGGHSEVAFLSALAMVVAGNELDSERVKQQTGTPARSIVELARRLQRARYAACIVGEGFPAGPDPVGAWELLYQLVNRLNTAGRRCVIVKAGGPGNALGAEAVFGWRAGFGRAIDFAAGDPRYRPGQWSFKDLWNGRGTDLLVGVGDPPSAKGFPDGLPKPTVPVVWLRPARPLSEIAAGFSADVLITTATPGWDESGTFLRSDGQPVQVRRIVDAALPTAGEIIRELAR